MTWDRSPQELGIPFSPHAIPGGLWEACGLRTWEIMALELWSLVHSLPSFSFSLEGKGDGL